MSSATNATNFVVTEGDMNGFFCFGDSVAGAPDPQAQVPGWLQVYVVGTVLLGWPTAVFWLGF